MLKIMTFIRHNAISLLALFVALGGTSYAAFNLPPGSVGTRELRNGSVTNGKLAKKAVTAANLDPRSIAGHIADWAQIRADGHVVSSSPHASVSSTDPTRGLFRVSWHRSIPSNCIAIANPVNVAPIAPASASTFGPAGHGRSANLLVETFDGTGNNVPLNVNVMVVCP